MRTRLTFLLLAAACTALLAFTSLTPGVIAGVSAFQGPGGEIAIDGDDIGGVVTGAEGPEAGVWVIAETTDLPTKFAKIVVTDDRGRYLDARSAEGELQRLGARLRARRFAEGRRRRPGKTLNLTAVAAPNAARGRASTTRPATGSRCCRCPDKSEFPGTGPTGNGIAPTHEEPGASGCASSSRAAARRATSSATRARARFPTALGTFDVVGRGVGAADAVRTGRRQHDQRRSTSSATQRALTMFADWTDRIAAGEVPPAPPRPQGIERNVVITEWDWADPKAYLHDEVSTDRRNPTRQRERPDLRRARAERRLPAGARSRATHTIEPRAADGARSDTRRRRRPTMPQPSPYWGDEVDLDQQEQRPQPDARRARAASGSRPPCGRPTTRTFCKAGLDASVGEAVPDRSGRPAPRDVRPEDEEADAHQHLLRHAPPDVRRGREQHAVDERRRAGGRLAEHEDVRRDRRRGEVAGLDRAHPRHQRQRQARRVRRAQPAGRSDEGQAHRRRRSTPSRRRPTARSGARCSASPARSSGSCPGANPPETALAEVYEPPFDNPRRRCRASRRAAWTSIATASSGRRSRAATWRASIAASARGRSTARRRPASTAPRAGRSIAEPLPQFKGVTDSGSAEASYYTWVDQFDTLGLGANTPINTGNASEGAAGAEGRQVGRAARAVSDWASTRSGWTAASTIPNAGWKGRGLWATVSTRAPFHMEAGKGTTSKVMKFQLRPDPLAK